MFRSEVEGCLFSLEFFCLDVADMGIAKNSLSIHPTC